MTNQKQKLTQDRLVLLLSDELTDLRIIADSIKKATNVLSVIAQDAEEKSESPKQDLFLWDNNDQLQVVDSFLHRLVKELYSALEKADETQRMLSNTEDYSEKEGER